MEINGVKLPTQKDFDSTARVFRRMFNDGPSRDQTHCYIKLNDGKFECVWGKTSEDVHLIGKGGLDINVDRVVLTSWFCTREFSLRRRRRFAKSDWLWR